MSETAEPLFQQMYRDHADVIGKAARAFTQNAADRDDLAQEILIALWQALPGFRGQAKLSTYVYRVAHSTAMNWKRSRQRYARKVENYALNLMEPVVSPRDRERIEWLYTRIRELPPTDRTLLLLYLDQISYAEIAEITGLSESNIGVRLHRLKSQLSSEK
ncbi:RNA polymerase sigma factor [Oleiharenicola lentus]|uniref:RNA polymerase sigma factor n=1 Tax=Oleiharenicola lentus TaxID=2508720 RepID=UPI003F68093D